MSKRVITFGEIMLRLAPEGYYRFVQAITTSAQHTAAARLTKLFPLQTTVLTQGIRYKASEARDRPGSCKRVKKIRR